MSIYQIGKVRMPKGRTGKGVYITGLQDTKERFAPSAIVDVVNREDDKDGKVFFDDQFVQYKVDDDDSSLIKEVKLLVEE